MEDRRAKWPRTTQGCASSPSAVTTAPMPRPIWPGRSGSSTRIVKIPCTGKLDVLLVLDAFEHGADGVMVAGCLEGDCHYQQGNLNARSRVNRARELLRQIGLDPERVRMFNMSSAMGAKWVEAVGEMDRQVQALG